MAITGFPRYGGYPAPATGGGGGIAAPERYRRPRRRRENNNLGSVGFQGHGGVGALQRPIFDNTGKAKRGRRFKPFVAPDNPPPGTYDPVLDATLRASRRGLGDFTRDTERDTTRRADDYSLATGIIGTDRTQALGDIMRNYRNLATAQTSGAASAGVLGGGTLAAAAKARAGNQGRETFRTNQSADRRLADLALSNTRATEDSTTSLDRAGREQRFFEQDTRASELFQAKQGGWIPPERPKNQRNINGQVVHVKGNMVTLPNGTMMTREEALRRFGKGHWDQTRTRRGNRGGIAGAAAGWVPSIGAGYHA